MQGKQGHFYMKKKNRQNVKPAYIGYFSYKNSC